MNRQKWFLWIDRLKITRAERTVVSGLVLVGLVLLLIKGGLDPHPPFDNADYKKLDRLFAEQTQQFNKEQKRIQARYDAKIGVTNQETAHSKNTTDEKSKSKAGRASTKVDINKAAANALTILPGIGPVTARRIVAYRNEHGRFEKVDELIRVKGIGRVTLEKMSPNIAEIAKQ